MNTPSKENVENEQPQSEVKEGGEEEEAAKLEEEGESASQELKTEGEGETSVNSLVGGRDTEGETNSQGVKVEEEGEMNIDDSANHSRPASTDSTGPADVSTFPSEEDQNIDPATGECKVVTMDTEEQSNTAEAGDTTTQGRTFPNYASSGPLPDQRDTAGLLEDSTSNETERPISEREEGEEGREKKSEDREITELPGDVTLKENKKEDSEITELLGAITLDEKEPPATASVIGEEGEEEGGEKREDSEPTNLSVDFLNTISTDAALERLKVQVDSVEGSLKRFCTPELLTGSNKFACAVCTKEKAGKETALEQEEGKRETEERQKGESEDEVNIEVEEGEGGQAETELEGKDQAKETVHHKPEKETENDVQGAESTAESISVVSETPSVPEEGRDEDSAVSPQSPPSSDGEEEEHRPSGFIINQLPNEEPPPSSVLPRQDDPSSSTAQEEELLPGDGQDDLPLLGEKDSKGKLV